MAIITEQVGDIFSAPSLSILIHACNARGAWGSGVALAFKQHHPSAFRKYNAHCLSPPPTSKSTVKQHQANIVGTTLLIPPTPPNGTSQHRSSAQTQHYIACLFTSLDYGKRVSPAEKILENTGKALKDLARQVAEMRTSGEEVGKCYAVRINSGKFGVEWEKTKAVLEAGELDVTVVRPAAEGTVDGADLTAGSKIGRPYTASGGAKVSNIRTAMRAKVKGPLDRHMGGVKRKLETDDEGDVDDNCEHAKRKESAPLHPGVAKRRKKLGLDR